MFKPYKYFSLLPLITTPVCVLGSSCDDEKVQSTKSERVAKLMVLAASHGFLSEMKNYLDKYKANIDGRGQFGETGLACAAAKGHIEIVKELIKRGANPTLTGKSVGSTLTALELAKYHNHRELIPILENYEKDYAEMEKTSAKSPPVAPPAPFPSSLPAQPAVKPAVQDH